MGLRPAWTLGYRGGAEHPFPSRGTWVLQQPTRLFWQRGQARLFVPALLPLRAVFAQAVNTPGVGCACQRYCTVERTWRNQPGNEACYCSFLILKRKRLWESSLLRACCAAVFWGAGCSCFAGQGIAVGLEARAEGRSHALLCPGMAAPRPSAQLPPSQLAKDKPGRIPRAQRSRGHKEVPQGLGITRAQGGSFVIPQSLKASGAQE